MYSTLYISKAILAATFAIKINLEMMMHCFKLKLMHTIQVFAGDLADWTYYIKVLYETKPGFT